jgi:hypothetical protein
MQLLQALHRRGTANRRSNDGRGARTPLEAGEWRHGECTVVGECERQIRLWRRRIEPPYMATRSRARRKSAADVECNK